MGFWDAILGLFRRKDAAAWAADARELLARNRAPRALASAERAVGMAPDDPDLLLLRSQILRGLSMPERALEDVLAALERDPGRAANLLPVLEELEPSAPAKERVWLHTWKARAEAGDLPEAAARLRRLAGRGAAAVEALRAQCRGMIEGTGDRAAGHLGLAILAAETGDAAGAVSRAGEAAAAGGRPYLALAEGILADLADPARPAPGALRALVAARVALGKDEEARAVVVDLCRRDGTKGVALFEELLKGEPPVAAFAVALLASLEKAGKVPVRLSLLLAEEHLRAKRAPEAARVVLRAVTADPGASEAVLPVATRVMKEDRGLDALEAHGRAAALAGDDHSCLLTLGEFVDRDPGRAKGVLDLLPAEARQKGEGALLAARVQAGLGDHRAAAADLRRWALGGGGAGAKDALPHVRGAAAAHPGTAEYALLLQDLLQSLGDAAGAGRVLLDLVSRDPGQAEAVAERAASLLRGDAASFEAALAAGRAGLARSADPAAVLGHFRSALEAAPGREAEVLACLEGAERWIRGVEPLEIFRADRILAAGRVEEGIGILEEAVVRNPARGAEALGVLRGFQQGKGAGDPRLLFAEHRVRKALRDYEGCVVPLRRVADLVEGRREEVLAALDAVLAEAPACRGAHRGGVEISLRLGRPAAQVLARLEALLDIPTPPRDTEFVSRRALGIQNAGESVAGHRLLVRCHLFAARFPLALEEVRRMVERDPRSRGEAVVFLGHIVGKVPALREARFLLASLHAGLGAADAAREALAGAHPRTEEVFEAWRRLVEAFPNHPGVRLDLVDALTGERRIDDALEEAARLLDLRPDAGAELAVRVERILDLAPEYAPGLYALAKVHHALGEWEREIAAFRRIIRLSPREAETVLQRLDLVLEKDPKCVEASLEILRLVPLHQRTERAAPEGRRALGAAAGPEQVAAVADALEALERALAGDAGFTEVLAEARTRARRAFPAVATWARVLDLDASRAAAAAAGLEVLAAGDGKEAVEALRVLSRALLLSGDVAGACRAADAFLERRPKEVEAARDLFRRALESKPASREAAAGVARTSVLVGDPEGAVEAHLHDLRQHPENRREVGLALKGLRERFPDHPSAPLAQAEFHFLPLDLLEDAGEALEAAHAIDPSRHPKVLALADALLSRDPRSVRGTRVRGRALAAAGRLDEAVAAFGTLVQIDPARREDALAGIEEILAAGPAHPAARQRRSELLVDLGRPAEAAAQCEAILASVRPGDRAELAALFTLVAAREALGEFDAARDALRRAGKNHPGEASVPVRLRAGMAARLAARTRELRAAPDAAKAGGSALDLAAALADAGECRAALAAVGPQPEKAEALARWRMLRGRAFVLLGEAGAALDELDAALEPKGMEEGKSETARDALFFCGVAHLRCGEVLKAIRRFEQLARVAPSHRRVREVLDRVYDEDRRRLERPLETTVDLESLPAVPPGAARG